MSLFKISMFNSGQPNIAIISTMVFLHILKISGSSKFQLYLCSFNIQTSSTHLVEALDLSSIPSEYHEFINIYNLWLVLFTLFWYLNKKLSRNSLRKISIWVSFNQPYLCMVYTSLICQENFFHYVSIITIFKTLGLVKQMNLVLD